MGDPTPQNENKETKQSKKEVVEVLLMIHDRHRNRFDQRRSYEWKMSLAVWSALGIIIAGILSMKDPIDLGAKLFSCCPIWILGVVTLVLLFAWFFFWWLRPLLWRHGKDQEQARDYLDAGTEIALDWLPSKTAEVLRARKKEHDEQTKGKCAHQNLWGYKIHLGITSLLVMGIIFAVAARVDRSVSSPPCSCEQCKGEKVVKTKIAATQQSKPVSGQKQN